MHNRIVCLGGVVLSIGLDLAFNTMGVRAMFYGHTKSGDGQSDMRRKLMDRYIACIDNSSTMVGSVVKTNVFIIALATGPIIGSNGFGISQVTRQGRQNDFLRPRRNRFGYMIVRYDETTQRGIIIVGSATMLTSWWETALQNVLYNDRRANLWAKTEQVRPKKKEGKKHHT